MKLQSVTLKQGTHHTPVLTAGKDFETLEMLPCGVVAARAGKRVELFWEVSKAVAVEAVQVTDKPKKG